MLEPPVGRPITALIAPFRALRGPRAETSPRSTQQAASRARRDTLILEHLPLTRAIAIHVHANLPVHVDLDDMVHAGILGLIHAADKFDANKEVPFSSYAKHRIKGAILDSLRQLDWASRDVRRLQKQVESATGELVAKLQRAPTETELAERLGVDIKRLRAIMLDLSTMGPMSASTRANENDDLPAPDLPGKPDTRPDSICGQEQLRGVLGKAASTLPERYQQVMSLYYTKELTMREIGRTLGVNESRVSQIHKTALQKMAIALRTNGIDSMRAF
jgi:RNA polymerase sigma factor for flagellar operon FliA